MNYSYKAESDDYALNYDLEELVENGSVILTGNDVKNAVAQFTQDSYGNSKPVVSMTFTDAGADIFSAAVRLFLFPPPRYW